MEVGTLVIRFRLCPQRLPPPPRHIITSDHLHCLPHPGIDGWISPRAWQERAAGRYRAALPSRLGCPGNGLRGAESSRASFLGLEFHCGKSPRAPTADSSVEACPGNRFPRFHKLTCRKAINMFTFVSMSISFPDSLI